MIFASGLKYVGVGTAALGWTLCAVLLAGAFLWLFNTQPWQKPSPPEIDGGDGDASE